jgi:predicted enzyme related to lactoylglutathione lyase
MGEAASGAKYQIIPVEETTMANPFVHLELITGDVDKAKAFYGSLFDWNLRFVPGMNYMIVKVGKGTCGGMMACLGPEVSPQWLPHVHVEDIADRDEGGHRGAGEGVVRHPGRPCRRRPRALAAQDVTRRASHLSVGLCGRMCSRYP